MVEPRSGISPGSFGGPFRNAEEFSGLMVGKANEKPQFNEFGCRWILLAEFLQRIVQQKEQIIIGVHREIHLIEIDALQSAAVFAGGFFPGAFDENPAHGLSRGRKEMPAAVPMHRRISDQTKPGLMHQSRCLQWLPRPEMGHFVRGQFAQLIIDQRQELISGLGLALFDGFENARDIAHNQNLPEQV